MKIGALIDKARKTPELIEFSEVISVIENHYYFSPTRFTNDLAVNEAGINEGSYKIFAFAMLNNLGENETLALFGKFYRVDVLQNSEGSDHANIRNFIQTGWAGTSFDQMPLTAKS